MSIGPEWIDVGTANQYREHLEAVAVLFEAVFQRPYLPLLWNQFYLENPYGDPLVALAYSGSTLVAHQALIPQVATNGNKTVHYHLSLSTMVHPAHRSLPVFLELFKRVHRASTERASAFVLGFPNANLYMQLRRCFAYQTLAESPLCSWVTPQVDCAILSMRDTAWSAQSGRFGPPATVEYWAWRTRLNQARACTVNGRLQVVYKLLDGGILNLLHTDVADPATARMDLAGLVAAEQCCQVRLTERHATLLGLAPAELRDHEGYCLRMLARPLCASVPELDFNLLLCDIF